MAIASWPGRSACESPNSTAVRSDAVIRMTATSVSRSWPMRSAGHSRPSGSVTSIVAAPSTTWLFVRMRPSVANTNPDPLPVCARVRFWLPGALTLMLTTAGATRSTA